MGLEFIFLIKKEAMKRKKGILKWDLKKLNYKLENSKYMETTWKILRERPTHLMEKCVRSSLRSVKTIIKIIQSKTKMKKIQTYVRPRKHIHLMLDVKLKQSF